MTEALVTRAARIVAAAAALRRVPAYSTAYGEPLRRLLEELAEHAFEAPVHIRLEPSRPGGAGLLRVHESMVELDVEPEYNRLTHYFLRGAPTGGRLEVYAENVRGRIAVGVFDGGGEPESPWNVESLQRAVRSGDHGLLGIHDIWRNPFITGRIRSLVWSHTDALWRNCATEAGRLAWEALSNKGPWTWHFQLEKSQTYWLPEGKRNPLSEFTTTRQRLLRAVARKAGQVYGEYRSLPTEIPLSVLTQRGKAGYLEAMAFWLTWHRMGPGIPPGRAAALLGCNDHTSVTNAAKAYRRKHPKAPGWPGKHLDWGLRIRVGDDAVMSHHI